MKNGAGAGECERTGCFLGSNQMLDTGLLASQHIESSPRLISLLILAKVSTKADKVPVTARMSADRDLWKRFNCPVVAVASEEPSPRNDSSISG